MKTWPFVLAALAISLPAAAQDKFISATTAAIGCRTLDGLMDIYRYDWTASQLRTMINEKHCLLMLTNSQWRVLKAGSVVSIVSDETMQSGSPSLYVRNRDFGSVN